MLSEIHAMLKDVDSFLELLPDKQLASRIYELIEDLQSFLSERGDSLYDPTPEDRMRMEQFMLLIASAMVEVQEVGRRAEKLFSPLTHSMAIN